MAGRIRDPSETWRWRCAWSGQESELGWRGDVDKSEL